MMLSGKERVMLLKVLGSDAVIDSAHVSDVGIVYNGSECEVVGIVKARCELLKTKDEGEARRLVEEIKQ